MSSTAAVGQWDGGWCTRPVPLASRGTPIPRSKVVGALSPLRSSISSSSTSRTLQAFASSAHVDAGLGTPARSTGCYASPTSFVQHHSTVSLSPPLLLPSVSPSPPSPTLEWREPGHGWCTPPSRRAPPPVVCRPGPGIDVVCGGLVPGTGRGSLTTGPPVWSLGIRP